MVLSVSKEEPLKSLRRIGLLSLPALAVACGVSPDGSADPHPADAIPLDPQQPQVLQADDLDAPILPTVWHTNADGEPTRFSPEAMPERVDLRAELADRLDRSELAFVGEVVAIDTAFSRPGPGLQHVPHTFITYRIDQPLRGGEIGEQITLRFLGGPTPDGGGMLVTHTPRIDLGDRDLLFVAGNGTQTCPLVDCEDGRLRVVDDALYTEHGRPLRDLEDRLIFGARQDLAEVRTHHIGATTFTRHAPPPSTDPLPGQPITTSELVDLLGAPGPGAHAVASADPAVAFDFPISR